MFVNQIWALVTKHQLNEALKARHQGIRRYLGLFDKESADFDMIGRVAAFVALIVSWGNMKKSNLFWNYFVDIQAIENSDDPEIIKLMRRLMRLSSNFSKLWIIGVASLGIAFLFWPKK